MVAFSQVKPNTIKLRVLPVLPSRMDEGPGVSISRANGVTTVGLDYDDLEALTSFDPSVKQVAVVDTVTGEWNKTTFSDLLTLSGYAATSVSTNTIGTGSLTFATQLGLSYRPGARVRVAAASDSSKFVEGVVTAYSGANLTLTSDTVGGSGSFSSWNLNIAGQPGIGGTLGAATGSIGFTASNGVATTYMRSDGAPALARNLVDVGPAFAGLSTVYNGLFVSINGFTVGEMFGDGAAGLVQGFAAGVEISSLADYSNHSTGVAGYARTSSTSVGAVGLYGQGTMNGSGTNGYYALGGNFLAANTPFQNSATNTGFNGAVVGIEVDINYKMRGGAAPTGYSYGIHLQSSGAEVQPSGGFDAVHVTGGAVVPWKTALYTEDGSVGGAVSASEGGVNLGAVGTGNNVGSQPIVLRSRTSGGADCIASIVTDPNGDIILTPSTTGATVALSDGTNNALQATVGSSGVRFNQYGAGTLSTNSSGVISASSDASLKNIVGEFTRGLDDLRRMDPAVIFQWLSEMEAAPDSRYAGYTAQGVRKGIPEAVGQNPDGTLSLAVWPIIAALTNAVKTLSEEIDSLKRLV